MSIILLTVVSNCYPVFNFLFVATRREEEAQLQDGVEPGGPAAPQHQVLHGGPLLQHHTAAGRDAEDHLI